MALPVKALKAGQEAYWLDQIARNREEYFSGRGESPGRFVGSAATESGLEGVATAEQVRAMFHGLDPATVEVRCGPLWRADPRSKLAASPLLEALKARAAAQGIEDREQLAGSKALKGDVRAVQAACRLGGSRRVKVETVERLCCKVLGTDPRLLYGEGFERAWQHRGKRVNERVQASDHCFSSPKSVSLLAAGGGDQVRKRVAEARAEALDVGISYLERHGIGVRRDHNGTDRYSAVGGLVAVAFEHRMSRAGDPNSHTHVLVQNAAQGPDGRSFSCTDPVNPFLCNSTATGVVHSNLSTTPGTVDYALVIDFSPGFNAPCNVVDETAVSTFQAGTITVHSHHQDCPATIRPGPRINTDFQVTSGTGAFARATGSGAEHGGAAIVYHGRIFI